MCGICGIMLENCTDSNFPIGNMLYEMMKSQQVRAQDSAGIAIFNDGKNSSNIDSFYNLAYFMKTIKGYNLVEEQVAKETTCDELHKLLAKLTDKGASIIGYEKDMRIVKSVGLVRDLDRQYNIKSMKGSHGIGHLRIATSSQVDPSNAHPFSTTVMPDIAVVHNGEITNYANLRSSLELKGYPFYSNCDSEVIAVFLADQILKHGDLERAHYEFIRKADGPFTYITATKDSLALIRDKFGTRKGIIGYNPGREKYPAFWAMATDLSALDIIGANERVKTALPGKPMIFYNAKINRQITREKGKKE